MICISSEWIWWILNCHRLNEPINAIIFVRMFGVVKVKISEMLHHTFRLFIECILYISHLWLNIHSKIWAEWLKWVSYWLRRMYSTGRDRLKVFCEQCVCVQRLIGFLKSMLPCRDLLYKWPEFPHIFRLLSSTFSFAICLKIRSLCHSCELLIISLTH